MTTQSQPSRTLSVPEAVTLGVQCLRAGKLAEAESVYRQILERFPDHPDALHFLGLTLHQQGRSLEGIELIRRALEVAPDYLDAQNNLGNLLQQLGRLEEAAAAFREGILRAPDHAPAHNNLGVVLKEMGDLRGALDEFEKAAGLDREFPEPHLNQGHLLAQQGEHAAAIEAFQTAIKLRPDNAEAHRSLGRVYQVLNRQAEAEQALRRAKTLKPGDGETQFYLANALYRQGRLAEAADAYRTALSADPSLTAAYGNLGNTLLRLGRDAEAAGIWQEWLQRDPANPVARHMAAAVTGRDVPPRAGDEYIARTFDNFAASFDERLSELEYRAPELVGAALSAVIGAPQAALAVLDAGCGTGLCGLRLRPYAKSLTGVDLSPAMLAKARKRGIYDHLLTQELTAHLREAGQEYDLIAAADTLVYFGELEAIFAAAAQALQPGGRFIFTVECAGGGTDGEARFVLHPHGRYSHGERYVRAALEEFGLAVQACTPAVLRTEAGQPVRGLIMIALKRALLPSDQSRLATGDTAD